MRSALVLAAVWMLVGCSSGEQAAPSATSPAQPSVYVGVQPISGTPAEVEFGSSVEFTNGALLTVDAPTAFEPSAAAAGHTERNRAVTMTVTAENKAAEGSYKPEWVLFGARAGTQECTRVYDIDYIAYPQTPLALGDKVSWEVAWSCPDASADQLTVSAEASDMDPQGSGVWTGPFEGSAAPSTNAASQQPQTPGADASDAASRLANAGLCYPPAESLTKAMGEDFIVCGQDPANPYNVVLINKQPWSPANAQDVRQCSETPIPDRFGIVVGDSWFLTTGVNQPRAVMEKLAQVTGGEWLTWRQACS